MSEASDRAKAELDAARERHRATEIEKTDSYRSENYAVIAGPHRNYVGASIAYNNGGVDIDITEYTINVASVCLTRDETIALIEGLKKLIK